jgi:hypothetical protein
LSSHQLNSDSIDNQSSLTQVYYFGFLALWQYFYEFFYLWVLKPPRPTIKTGAVIWKDRAGFKVKKMSLPRGEGLIRIEIKN